MYTMRACSWVPRCHTRTKNWRSSFPSICPNTRVEVRIVFHWSGLVIYIVIAIIIIINRAEMEFIFDFNEIWPGVIEVPTAHIWGLAHFLVPETPYFFRNLHGRRTFTYGFHLWSLIRLKTTQNALFMSFLAQIWRLDRGKSEFFLILSTVSLSLSERAASSGAYTVYATGGTARSLQLKENRL